MGGTFREDDVLGFDTRWDVVLLAAHEVPSDGILESSNKTRIRESDQLKTVLAFHDQDILQNDMPPSYQRLESMVRARIFFKQD